MNDTTRLTNTLAEQAVLGCLLQANLQMALTLLGRLCEDDFADPRHRAVLAAARLTVTDGTPPDPVTVLARMREQGHALYDLSTAGPYMVDLMRAAPTLGSATHYATAVVEDSYRRRVQQAGVRLIQAAETASWETLNEVLLTEDLAVHAARARLTEATA